MKKAAVILFCVVMLSIILMLQTSALSYYVSYYEEAIYAGGVVDLYAYPSVGNTEDYTYQWQYDAGFGDEHWYDVPDNDSYSGGKTNHMRMYTSTGNYEGWEKIPFQCVVTSADGTVRTTDNIYMYIYPTDKLIPNMKNWGYGLYTPSITNVTDFYTKDNVNYTASTCAGTNMKIFCGSKSIDDKPVLRKSEVVLKTEIHITENGQTIVSDNYTSYIPYTVGKIRVQIKEKLTIGEFDLGYFDTETVDITVNKPKAIATGTARSACSLLRYTYNEAQKLASIPKGTSLEIVGTEGSYYQVYYNGYVGYVGSSLLDTYANNNDKLITNVDININRPVAGQTPAATCSVGTVGCELYNIDPVTWTESSTGKLVKPTDKFQEGKQYTVSIWVAAKSGYKFQTDAAGKPKLTGSINGNLPPFINKAYEQDPEQVIELTYTFGSTPKQTEALETEMTPTVTEPIHTHTPSDWRTTGAYHYKICTACGDFLTQEDHKGGNATCKNPALCSVCGYAYIEPNEKHTPDTSKWTACGSLYHAYLCKICGAHCDPQDHTPGAEATDTTAQICTVCGYVLQPAKNHTHQLTYMPYVPATCLATGTVEHYSCSGCSSLFFDKEGTKQLPEGTSIIIPYLTHETSDDWRMDEEFHWRICKLCQTVLDETKMLHEAEEGKCTTCGYAIGSGDVSANEDHNIDPTETNPSANGDKTLDGNIIVTLIVIAVIVVICFVVAALATVIILKLKKKKGV